MLPVAETLALFVVALNPPVFFVSFRFGFLIYARNRTDWAFSRWDLGTGQYPI